MTRQIGILARPTAALFAALTLSSCGGGGPTGAASNMTTVMLRDSPFRDARAVLVTFTDVSAHASGGTFFVLPFPAGTASRTCDLKKLVGTQDVLGVGPLPLGHYTQIRLNVSSASIYFDNPSLGPACADTIGAPAGRVAPVTIPSGEVKLNREFDVTMPANTITIDFDGDLSIHETGNGMYKMTPVLSVVSVQ